jgi:hypothetical protein
LAENKVGEGRAGELAGKLVANRFLLNEKLGEGSIWVVYLAQDVKTGQRVAVKVLRDEVAAEPEASTRFLKQAEDGFKLNHPSIVRSLATGSEAGHHFLITEYVQGRNIRQWFSDEGRDFNKLREKLKALCDALLYAHANGIFHRSLKPENVLIDENDQLKIADFGFARRLEGETRAAPGEASNVAYITPEQAKGQRGDARSDLYSLGVLIYELAAGKVPFWAPDPVRIVFMHINEAPVRPRHINPKVPMWVEHVVMRLLQKDPGQRYQSVREVKDEIARLGRHNEGEFIELDASDSAQARRPLGQVALVHRERAELELRELLSRAGAGHGAVVLVHGPTGVGKTRLLNDIGTYANLMGFAALRGAASRTTHSPLSPFMAIIREYLRRSELRVKDVVSDESGMLDYFLEGRIDQVIAPEPQSALPRYEDLIAGFLHTVSLSQPVLLVLEHLSSMDEASLRLIQRLAEQAPSNRLIVALTWREGALPSGGAAERMVESLRASEATRDLALAPLDSAGIRALVLALVGAERLSDRLLAAIEAASDGIPLHVEEMLALLMRDRLLEVVDGSLQAVGDDEEKTVDRILSMRGLPNLFEKRVATLPEKVAMLLTVAACIGPSFDFEVLMKVSGKPQDEVISILQWALRNHLIEEEWSPSREAFRFRHDEVNEALVAALEARSRKRLHLLVGGAAEEAFGPRQQDVFEALAHHFEASEQMEKAIEYAAKAADRFHAFAEAELADRYYADALRLADGTDTVAVERRIQWLKRRAQIARLGGREAEGRAFAEQALSLARERNDDAEQRELETFLRG